MHVVQLGPIPPPEGGISRNILAIREELRSRGERCSIIATSRSSEITAEADVYHPRSPLELVRRVRSLRPDVLHLHIGGELTGRVMALAVASTVLAKHTVLTLHSGAFPLTRQAVGASPGSFRGRVFRRFSNIIAVNDTIAEVFRRYGVEDDRINVISAFAVRSPDPAVAVPEDLESFFDSHSPSLIAVGGLEKDYDPLFQIRAMNQIVRDLPNSGLMIIGNGSMRAEAEAAIEAAGRRDNIMLAGNVDHPVTLHLIRRADMLLRTTLFDGDAISVREALFLGTPVIATDNSMRPAGVELIRPGDRDQLISMVKKLAQSPRQPASLRGADNSNIQTVADLYRSML